MQLATLVFGTEGAATGLAATAAAIALVPDQQQQAQHSGGAEEASLLPPALQQQQQQEPEQLVISPTLHAPYNTHRCGTPGPFPAPCMLHHLEKRVTAACCAQMSSMLRSGNLLCCAGERRWRLLRSRQQTRQWRLRALPLRPHPSPSVSSRSAQMCLGQNVRFAVQQAPRPPPPPHVATVYPSIPDYIFLSVFIVVDHL